MGTSQAHCTSPCPISRESPLQTVRATSNPGSHSSHTPFHALPGNHSPSGISGPLLFPLCKPTTHPKASPHGAKVHFLSHGPWALTGSVLCSQITLASGTHLPQGLCTCYSGCLFSRPAPLRLPASTLLLAEVSPHFSSTAQMCVILICLLCTACWAINFPQLGHRLPAHRTLEAGSWCSQSVTVILGDLPLGKASGTGSSGLPKLSPPPPPQEVPTTLLLAQGLGSCHQAGKGQGGIREGPRSPTATLEVPGGQWVS